MPKKKDTASAIVVAQLTPELCEGLAGELARAREALPMLASLALDTQEQMDLAGTFLSTVRGAIKDIEARRTAITDPLQKEKAAIDAEFRPVRQFYEACEKALKERIEDRLRAVAADQARALAAVAAAGGNADARTLMVAQGQEQVTLPASGVGTRSVWRWRIIDQRLIPLAWYKLDAPQLDYQAKTNGRAMVGTIPGIEFYEDTQVVGRG